MDIVSYSNSDNVLLSSTISNLFGRQCKRIVRSKRDILSVNNSPIIASNLLHGFKGAVRLRSIKKQYVMEDDEPIPLASRGKLQTDDKPLVRTRGRARGRSRMASSSTHRPGESASLTTTSISPEPCSSSGVSTTSLSRDVERLTYSMSTSLSLDNASGDKLAAKLEIGKPKNAAKKKEMDMLFTKPTALISKQGTTGEPIQLRANYFSLPTVPNWGLNQYRVDFSPEEDRNAVKAQMLKEHKDALAGGYIFDGTVMFTPYRYEKDPLVFHSTRRSDNAVIQITIRLVGSLQFGDYHYVHFFNLVMRRCLQNLKLQLVGRHYFDAMARQSIKEYRLELWPGYITSIRQHERELLLCAEITHKVMRQETVYDLLEDCVNRNPTNYKIIFKKAIIGSIVLTDYNNRTYRIDDVDFTTSPASVFDRNGAAVTYQEYFVQKYEIKIKSPNQPMLVTMPKQRERKRGLDTPIYLVPELCRMTGLTDEMRTNFDLMRKLADATRLGPSQRMERLQYFNRRLHTNELNKQELESWQMSLSQNLVQLPGRILPTEKIILGPVGGNPMKCDAGPKSDWTGALKSKPMLASDSVDSWMVIVPRTLKYDAQQFVSQLRKSAAQMEWRMSEPTYRDLDDDKVQSFVEAIGNGLVTCNPKFILVVLPTNRQDRYSAIKKKCCVECAVPTQIILRKNLTSKNMASIATKVAIQLNCKVGGAPWTVEIPMKGLMVVGFDVYHDSLQKGLSIGALVASLDKAMSRYFSAVSYHKTGEELSNELSANMCKALHKFKQYNNALPSRIVIYRDGVGEGQLQYVYQHEVALLEDTLKKMYCGASVQMAFIVVTKRIHTRLFCDGTNPPPGTVVDDIITLPERYDFFLVSQSVRQGTVSPTCYNVIYDTLGLDPDKLQRLTYKLTHLYFNWSGTVRVPAPVQYAHKLAFLVGQALHKIPCSHLNEILYFL